MQRNRDKVKELCRVLGQRFEIIMTRTSYLATSRTTNCSEGSRKAIFYTLRALTNTDAFARLNMEGYIVKNFRSILIPKYENPKGTPERIHIRANNAKRGSRP